MQSDLEKWQQEITKSDENLVDYQRQVKVLQKELEENHRSWSQTQWELDKIRREHDKLEHAYIEVTKKLADSTIDQESVSVSKEILRERQIPTTAVFTTLIAFI